MAVGALEDLTAQMVLTQISVSQVTVSTVGEF